MATISVVFVNLAIVYVGLTGPVQVQVQLKMILANLAAFNGLIVSAPLMILYVIRTFAKVIRVWCLDGLMMTSSHNLCPFGRLWPFSQLSAKNQAQPMFLEVQGALEVLKAAPSPHGAPWDSYQCSKAVA